MVLYSCIQSFRRVSSGDAVFNVRCRVQVLAHMIHAGTPREHAPRAKEVIIAYIRMRASEAHPVHFERKLARVLVGSALSGMDETRAQ